MAGKTTSINAFREARNCFAEGTQFISNLTFQEWSEKPEDLKAAILFVQFYNEVTMAWYKTAERYPFVDEEDSLAIIMQYLQKQVDRNLMTEDKFNSAYIYQVAWNASSGLGWTQRDQNRYANEVSEVVQTAEGEVSLYDTAVDSQSGDFDSILRDKEMMAIIANMGDKTQKVLNYLLNEESLRKVSTRNKTHDIDPLADVSVKNDEVEEIINEIKKVLLPFAIEKGYATA